jgi:hypothetical protein
MSYQDVLDEHKQEQDQFLKDMQASKTAMKYATIKLSDRRYAIIQYEGAGRYGGTDGYWHHSFSFVEGCEKLTFSEAYDRYRELVKGK